jgi:signal transduction histidine kinase
VKARNHLDDAAIRFNGPEEKIAVVGDRAELQTVFSNLLDNAVKYSNGEPKIVVRLKTSAMRYADVFVKDNGIGIEPGDLKRVFKRFYRASNGGSKKGTGLGLAIVKAIVKKHGGKVKAESKGLGRGSTFWVRLPRA